MGEPWRLAPCPLDFIPREILRASGEPAMAITVEATFENAVLKPKQPVVLREGTEVRLIISTLDAEYDPLEAVIGICDDASDASLAARRDEKLASLSRGSPGLARQTQGLIGWTGDPEVVRRIALDPEFDPVEGP